MDLATYNNLTGLCTSENENRIQANLGKAQSMLEGLLGYTLDPELVLQNLYNEQGISPSECSCSSVLDEDLLPPDAVEFAYRLYAYNPKDRYLLVDPFTEINKVKLVKNGVTIKTFEDDEYRIHYERDGVAKYIEICDECGCSCDCTDCVQLAVDADWLWQTFDDVPIDLQYIWADMVSYYADCKSDIKSESIGPHSYTKFDKTPPQDEPINRSVLIKYAGAYGSINKQYTL